MTATNDDGGEEQWQSILELQRLMPLLLSA